MQARKEYNCRGLHTVTDCVSGRRMTAQPNADRLPRDRSSYTLVPAPNSRSERREDGVQTTHKTAPRQPPGTLRAAQGSFYFIKQRPEWVGGNTRRVVYCRLLFLSRIIPYGLVCQSIHFQPSQLEPTALSRLRACDTQPKVSDPFVRQTPVQVGAKEERPTTHTQNVSATSPP